MFDLNTIINAALNAAVQQAIAPLMERIENLDAICQAQHEAMVAMRDRIAALENNPAQGQDLTANADVRATVMSMLKDDADVYGVLRDVAIEAANIAVEVAVERTMDHHLECYDHDSYDEIASKVEDYDFDDFVTNDNLEDAVREAVGNLSFEVSVS